MNLAEEDAAAENRRRVGVVVDRPDLRGRVAVFEDREDAGRALASLLGRYRGSGAVLVAIPAGGVPVAAAAAAELGLPLDVAVVSKITPPQSTEIGYGAVAFDGTSRIDSERADELGLSGDVRRRGIERTAEKVRRRVGRLRGGVPAPDVAGKTAILVDDGIASGMTLLVAAEAVKKLGPAEIVIAAPTGHARSVERLARFVEAVCCANIRGGLGFAVADAYRRWTDVADDEVEKILARSRVGVPAARPD